MSRDDPDGAPATPDASGPPGISTALAWVPRRATLVLAALLLLAAAGAAAWYLLQETVLTVAVAPRDGTEPDLIKAYADALEAANASVRLRLVAFDDVRDSAAALQDGRVDLAVVRPDVVLPTNGLTLAILRDQAMMLVSPEQAGIASFPKLAGKRLGIAAHRDPDIALLRSILGYYGLTLEVGPDPSAARGRTVLLVPVEQDTVAVALREKRIDAFVSIIAPSAPKALALVSAIQSVARDGRVEFVAVEDEDALIERFPRLQAVTIPGGLFTGRPKLPGDDVKTVGASYRLMARASLSRVTAADVTQNLFEKRTAAAVVTDAAEYVQAPAYDTTAAATSARIPIHPGAIDYYEREQHGFVDRYGDTLYLFGALAGGLVSALAWIRQRLSSLRREPVHEIIDRLIELNQRAQVNTDPTVIQGLRAEVDSLALIIVQCASRREADERSLATATLAIDTVRSALARPRTVT